jgi:hypothetical protein
MAHKQLETSSPSSEKDLSLLSQSQSEPQSGDDSQVQAYVAEFRLEIERKFAASRTNADYRFPRSNRLFDEDTKGDSESLSSLKDVTYYDLESQNVKRLILNPEFARRASETENLVSVIKNLGKLDSRYLSSQMRNPRSPLFKVLVTSLEKKLPKENKFTDSFKSNSIKPKSMVMNLKAAILNPSSKNSGEPISKNYLSSGYYNLSGSTNPSLRHKVLESSNSVSKLTATNPVCVNLLTIASPQTSRVNYSPTERRSPESSAFRKTDSFKLQGRLKKNFSSNNCAPPLSEKSTLNLTKVPKVNSKLAPVKQTSNNPIFNLMRKNFIHTNSNSHMVSANPLSSNSRSKSKLKDAPQKTLAPLLPMASATKNQINLTKEQLKSLIQKNLTRKSPQHQQTLQLKNVDKNLSRSVLKLSEKIALNGYSETGSGFYHLSGKRKENLRK